MIIMAVFKNLQGKYAIDYSITVMERLDKLWKTSREQYEELEDYIYNRFDWVAGLGLNVPDLYEHFDNKEDAQKRNDALHRAINKWFRSDMKSDLEKRRDIMLQLEGLLYDYLDYIDGFGNECAYTDSILESIKKKANEL